MTKFNQWFGNAKMTLRMIKVGGGMMEMESNNENENKIVKMITMVTRDNTGVKVLNHFCLNIYSLFVFFSKGHGKVPKRTRKVPCGKKNNWGAKKYHHKGVKRGFLSKTKNITEFLNMIV